MARFGATAGAMTPVAADTAIFVGGSATARCKLYEFGISNHATPADGVQPFELGYTTGAVAAVGTAITEEHLDPNSSDPAGVAVHTCTTEPTVYSLLMDVAVNQRATYRWVASPGGEVTHLKAANAGIGLRARTGGTFVATTDVYFMWEE